MSYEFSAYSPKNKSSEASNKSSVKRYSPYENVDERKVIFGTDINKSLVPEDTVKKGDYHIAFTNNNGESFGMNMDLLSKHLLLLGGIGCGKTNTFNFIVESLLSKMSDDDVVFIFDTKGDFKRKFYQSNNPRHIIIGNDSQYDQISKSWNIFDELRDSNGNFSKESELTAKEISLQLFKGRESESQPFFAQASSDLVSKVLIHLMRKAVRERTTSQLHTADFVSFVKGANQRNYFDMTEDPHNKDFVSTQLYFGKPSEKMSAQALGVFGYINAMVNDLFIGVFAERRVSGNVSMRELVRRKEKRVVFVEYDLSVGETLGPMYRILFDLALKEALGGRSSNRGNTYFVIDEFKLLPDLMHIDDALNFGRSLGVKVLAGLQSIDQLYQIYGEERGKVIASGFMNSFCFQTLDLDSRKFISERFGETYVSLSFKALGNPINIQREGHVVEDWDILNLSIGEAFINLFGYKPFQFQFSDFEKPHRIL